MSSDRPPVNTARPAWYRSLYWRISLGLFAFLALMLAAQGALFLWMNDRIAASMPARSPRTLALLVASDISQALEATNNALDLSAYVADNYGNVLQPFVVVMRDGRLVANQDDVPAELLEAARAERPFLRGLGRRGGPRPDDDREPPPPRTDGGRDRDRSVEALADAEAAAAETRGDRPRPDGPPPDGEPPPEPRGRGRRGGPPPGPRQIEPAPIIVNGFAVGRVAVWLGRPSATRIARQLGPTLALVGGSVLLLGTAAIAFVVFGPTRRRLKTVQEATERLGSGDLSARAPVAGGDEVSALARSFNQMADELARRAQALDLSDRARRQLLADVSHELMTPLTAIRGYVETLTMADQSFDAPTRERYLGIALDETHRLEAIIGDLLDLARLEGGGGGLRMETVPIQPLFDRVAARHEQELHRRGVTLQQHVGEGAGAVPADAGRLEQALQNLAANALRHTPDGGRISLTAAASPESIVLTVRDTGPGIDARHLPLIFDRFYKGDAARKAAGGSGLGLSIVKAIVERHGGTVSARNEHGAVFELVLPRIERHE
jgi:two-component system, OmpR family, sensor kinase